MVGFPQKCCNITSLKNVLLIFPLKIYTFIALYLYLGFRLSCGFYILDIPKCLEVVFSIFFHTLVATLAEIVLITHFRKFQY